MLVLCCFGFSSALFSLCTVAWSEGVGRLTDVVVGTRVIAALVSGRALAVMGAAPEEVSVGAEEPGRRTLAAVDRRWQGRAEQLSQATHSRKPYVR